jgi:A/G-specific adenine glycosylase
VDWLATELLHWFDAHGRKELPWQRDPTPYRVWVSEIMLQQTQVATVIPYFERFVACFPDVSTLARANRDEVLHLWSGLGYYARARNLHHAAQQIEAEDGGSLPETLAALTALPGIGRSTAGAILAIAHRQRATILDGNVKRVLARFHAIPGHPGQSAWLEALWTRAEVHTPHQRLPDYTQAIMDLGALVCRRRKPACTACPLSVRCVAHSEGTTDRFPEPRPRRALPVRRVRMFLIEDPGGRFLLERRGPGGLWGGLWGPPERSADYEPERLRAELGLAPAKADAPTAMTSFRHTFTHFHMDIEPVRMRAVERAQIHECDDLHWYDPEAQARIGLSSAAVKLIAAAAGAIAGKPADPAAPATRTAQEAI